MLNLAAFAEIVVRRSRKNIYPAPENFCDRIVVTVMVARFRQVIRALHADAAFVLKQAFTAGNTDLGEDQGDKIVQHKRPSAKI